MHPSEQSQKRAGNGHHADLFQNPEQHSTERQFNANEETLGRVRSTEHLGIFSNKHSADVYSMRSKSPSGTYFHLNRNFTNLLTQQHREAEERNNSRIEELSHTVQDILKSNQTYRLNLLQSHKGSTEYKVENTLLKKRLDALVQERNIWELEKGEFQQVISCHEQEKSLLKSNLQQSLMRNQEELGKVKLQVEFERKRSEELEKYNKELFSKLLNQSQACKDDFISANRIRQIELINEISKLKAENSQIKEILQRSQKQYSNMAQNYQDLQISLKWADQERSKKDSIKKIEDFLATRHHFNGEDSRIKDRHFQLIQKDREINELEKKHHEDRTHLILTQKQNQKLRQEVATLKEELSNPQRNTQIQDTVQFLKRNRETETLELECKISELGGRLSHEAFLREQMANDLTKQKLSHSQTQKQLRDLQEKLVELELKKNSQEFQLSQLVMADRQKQGSIEVLLKQKERENKDIRNNLSSVKLLLKSRDEEIQQQNQQNVFLKKKLDEGTSLLSEEQGRRKILEKKARELEKQLLYFSEVKTKNENEICQRMEAFSKMEMQLGQERVLREKVEQNLKNSIEEGEKSLTKIRNDAQLQQNQVNMSIELLKTQIGNYKKIVDQMKNNIVEKQSSIGFKNNEISSLTEELKEKSKIICQLKQYNLEAYEKINTKAKQNDKEMRQILGTLKNTEEEKQNLLEKCKKKEEILSSLTEELKEKNKIINQLKQYNLEVFEKIKAKTKQSDKEIGQILAKLKNTEEQKQNLLQKCKENEMLISNLSKKQSEDKQVEDELQKLRSEVEKGRGALQEVKKQLQDKIKLIETKDSVNAMLNQISADFNSSIMNLQEDKKQLSARITELEKDLEEAHAQKENQQEKLGKLSEICQNNNISLREKEGLIQNKESVHQQLSSLINTLNQKNAQLLERNQELNIHAKKEGRRIKQLEGECNSKEQKLEEALQELDRIGNMLSKRSEKYETELKSMKGVQEESHQKHKKMHEKVLTDFVHLQEQITQLKVTERRFIAIEETLHNLHQELVKSEHLWKQMSHHPASIGLKRFVNVMNASHRGAFSREIDKVLEYFARVNLIRGELIKHYNSMKMIYNLIDNSQQFKEIVRKNKK